LEFITKLAGSPHILQHINAAKYGKSEGICGEIPRLFAPLGAKMAASADKGKLAGVSYS